jgi:hypothetical protein
VFGGLRVSAGINVDIFWLAQLAIVGSTQFPCDISGKLASSPSGVGFAFGSYSLFSNFSSDLSFFNRFDCYFRGLDCDNDARWA